MLDFETYQRVLALYADYASVVDNNEWDKWPEFFTDACTYKIQPRENFDRGFPLATLSFESKGMLKDRVYGMTETIFHDPYYQRHVVGVPRILRVEDGRIEAQAKRYPKAATRSDSTVPRMNEAGVPAVTIAREQRHAKSTRPQLAERRACGDPCARSCG